ncbi:hypothetical protein BX286_2420 [Streptomyces sp. 3211.6]|nr:hypothetical protein [Streptomyces sp. 3211.6]RKT04467.1 hypothetical protein BX286_2420 [Streptomyces sp. 3211.6]
MRQFPVEAETPEVHSPPYATPSADLLDRVLAGWERFVDTFEETVDE